MQFYAPSYDYHGLKQADVRRVWGEVFKHYKALESLHLFSDVKVLNAGEVPAAAPFASAPHHPLF